MTKRPTISLRRAPLLAPLAVLALTMTACGGSSKSSSSSSSGGSGNGVSSEAPNQILQSAVNAADAAGSAHLAGSVNQNGQSISLDMSVSNGKGAVGTLTMNGQQIELRVTATTAYIRAGTAFWQAHGGAAAAQLLANKWLKAPTSSSSMQSFNQFTDLSALMSKLSSDHGTLAKGSTSTVDGQNVIEVKDTTKGGSLFVATTGKPYPIQISGKELGSGGSSGHLSFSQFGQPVDVTPPAQSVDLAQLQGK